MTITKVVKLSSKGQIVVPQEMREKLGLKPKSKLAIMLRGEEIVILPPDKYAQITRGLLKGTWGKTKKEVNKYLKKERDSWR